MAADDDLNQLIAQQATVIDETERAVETAEEQARRLMSQDRSLIARLVLYAYLGSLAFVLFYILFRTPGVTCDGGDACKAAEGWREDVKAMTDFVSTAILPIVTLVLGFYFGSEKSAR